MRVLLSTIGSRGDVQPILALGLALQALGHPARLCVAPNFKDWIESYGLEVIPIGPDLKKLTGGTVPGKPVLPSPEQLQKMADESVRTQFQVMAEALQGCDLAVAAGALQFALRSVAEVRGIPYVFAAYCPAVLPSPKYPPPKTGGFYPFTLPEEENLRLWTENEASFSKFAPAINAERAKIGLGPLTSVRDYMFTGRPWLAADPALAPASPAPGLEVVQTGAWLLRDSAPAGVGDSARNSVGEDGQPGAGGPAALPDALEQFLAAGEPPIYLGFGSMRAAERTGQVLIEAARAVGRRAILSQGWAGLSAGDSGQSGPQDDCLSIGDVDHAALFPRVAAVVHHGGAGTTHTAALAGRPQVIIPHNYDQFYYAHRVQTLGVGAAGPLRDDLSVDGLAQALSASLRPEVSARAQDLAGRMEPHGARRTAERLVQEFGR